MAKRIINTVIILSILFYCFACKNTENNTDQAESAEETEIPFDQTKWKIREHDNYPFRDQMLDDFVYNDTVRTLSKVEILKMLGEPDRINDNYLYYRITQKRLGNWPLHTKTMVIKFVDENTIEWIKIHE